MLSRLGELLGMAQVRLELRTALATDQKLLKEFAKVPIF